MSIKRALTKAAEKITGRKCSQCAYNISGRCCHPDGSTFMRCWQSITRPGFETWRPVHVKTEDKRREELLAPGRAAAEGFKAGLEVKPAPLTPEQVYLLEKIKATLDEAEETARESGLLTED